MSAQEKPKTMELTRSYAGMQSLLHAKLKVASDSISHAGTKGGVTEAHWIELIRQYLPKRYACDTAIVIDSKGHVSHQIDVVIYDPQYTPALLTQQSHMYIPAEAVYAVLECKPTLNKAMVEYAGDKAASVRALQRTSVEIVHAGGKYPAKALFPIPAGILTTEMGWSDGLGASFKSAMGELAGDKRLDFGCTSAGYAFDVLQPSGEMVIKADEGALMWFLFRLLGRLQNLGTVPAIDWTTYAAVLSQNPGDSGTG
ncbi:MAG TPA: DUF6602 domain-containing protein [Gammaproteobacteria bacterium]|jgi:hypothetical protein